jgi:quinol monooxygenase YgiN
MRRILAVAILLVGTAVAGTFSYQARAQQGLPSVTPDVRERGAARGMLLTAEPQPQEPPAGVFAPEPFSERILIADADPQAPQAAAPAPPAGPVHVITFVDITPDNRVNGTALCKQFVADSRKDPGVTRAELLAQSNRPNHLVMDFVFENQAAYERHIESARVKEFHNKLIPMIGSPFDERPHYIVP